MDIWAFWEPEKTMPAYLRLCVETWKKIPNAQIHLLNYRNLHKFIDIDAYGPNLFDDRFHMAQIGDAIRAMLLEKWGGVWLDVDIIVTRADAEKFLRHEKDVLVFGNLKSSCHASFVHTNRPGTLFSIRWVAHNKEYIWGLKPGQKGTWESLASFTEKYAYSHPQEVEILNWNLVHPAEQMRRVTQGEDYRKVYEDYFFLESHHLDEIKESVVILNNTWTPAFYKKLNFEELMKIDCTATNLLIETLGIKLPPSLKRVKITRG